MARSQERKRKRSDEPPQSSQPVKMPKRPNEDNFSPAFWDNLSKIPLTRRALRELDRRNDARHALEKTAHALSTIDVNRYSRRGGPNLRHLRGYPEPKSALSDKLSSSRSSRSRAQQSKSTKATTVTGKTRKSSAYGKDFQQHLQDHNIHMTNGSSQPANTKEIRSELVLERASLSPSKFSDSAFKQFQRRNDDSVFESDVMSTVIPVICGNSDIPSQQNVLFTELAPIADEDTVKPEPDFFDGTRLHELTQEVRDDEIVRSTAIPTKHASVPVVPNFYMEVKGPEGSAAVAQRRVCYDGAYGARAIHTLQSYGDSEPTYDGNAYTYSSTYHSGTGTLQLYAHHVTAPTTSGGRPEYHMNQIDSWGMTGNIDTFRRGVTAFRNARELADRHRRSFIQTANSRASRSGAVDDVSETPEDVNYSIDPADYSGWQDADDALQQQIADTNYAAYDDVAANVPQHLDPEEDSQDFGQGTTTLAFDDPSMSFTSRFTSVSTGKSSLETASIVS
ncbi:hypothetical protein V8C35DRAFT_194073 [Trichoderma chlorosporum]